MRIDGFPLAWRWTDDAHAKLPESVLAEIEPVDPVRAKELYRSGVSVSRSPAEGEASVFASDEEEATRRWLQRLPISPSARVTIVWSEQLGVSLPWETFGDFWSDFCYPSSDDLFVFREDGSCALSYDHSEVFRYSGVGEVED